MSQKLQPAIRPKEIRKQREPEITKVHFPIFARPESNTPSYLNV